MISSGKQFRFIVVVYSSTWDNLKYPTFSNNDVRNFFMILSRLVVKIHGHAVYLYFCTNSLLVSKENVSSYLQLLCSRAANRQSGRWQDVISTSCHRPDCLYWMHERNTIKLHAQFFLRMNTWMFETCRRHYN